MQNKVTVIIPTLLITNPNIFKYTLNELNSNELVEEIIIIDNTYNNEFKNQYKQYSKYNVIEPKNNIYVNNAWNLGLELCKTKYYLLLNDDIILKSNTINNSIKILNENTNIGILTVNTVENYNIKKFEEVQLQKEYTILDIKDEKQGWYIFGRKSEWTPIPAQFKLYFGDDIIYKNNKKLGLINCKLFNSDILSHFTSTTTHNPTIFKKILSITNNDYKEWEKYEK